MAHPPQPTWRKAAGIAAILLIIVAWAGIIVAFAQPIGKWPILVQASFYLIMGIVWILPLKPLLRWSETGLWRAARPPDRRAP